MDVIYRQVGKWQGKSGRITDKINSTFVKQISVGPSMIDLHILSIKFYKFCRMLYDNSENY
jgi:hypothetical protein